MRTLILSLSLAALAAVGFTASPKAAASDLRVYVDLGDIVFDYGRPYYRHGYVPLYVETARYGPPRYYYYPPRAVRHFTPPGHYVRHYGPPSRHHWKRHGKHHGRHDAYRDGYWDGYRDGRHRDDRRHRRHWDD